MSLVNGVFVEENQVLLGCCVVLYGPITLIGLSKYLSVKLALFCSILYYYFSYKRILKNFISSEKLVDEHRFVVG